MVINLRKVRAVMPKRKKGQAEEPPPPPLAIEDQTAAEILKRVREALSPIKVSLTNTSKAHAKHRSSSSRDQKTGGSKKGGSGGHYELYIVSDMFAGAPPLQRQRIVNDLLKDLMGKKIHALKLDLKDPTQVKLEENP